MRIGICGFPRQGKTLLQVVLGYIAKEYLGMDVLANFEVSFAKYINPIELLKFELENCVLLLDEAYTLIDSRLNTYANRLQSYFMFQSGKRDVDIIFTAQLLGSIDDRVRELMELKILAEKMKSEQRFRYTVFVGQYPISTFFLSFQNAEQFYPMYKTKVPIYPMEMVGRTGGTIDDILKIYKNSPNKLSFVRLLRKDNPYIIVDIAKTIYDLLKYNKQDEVKKLLDMN